MATTITVKGLFLYIDVLGQWPPEIIWKYRQSYLALQKFSVPLISIFVSDKNISEYIHFEILVNYFFVLLTPSIVTVFVFGFSLLWFFKFSIWLLLYHIYRYIFHFYSINNNEILILNNTRQKFEEIEEFVFKFVFNLMMESKKDFYDNDLIKIKLFFHPKKI